MADRVEQVHAFPDRWVVREGDAKEARDALVYRADQGYLVCFYCASLTCTHIRAVEEYEGVQPHQKNEG